MYEGISPNDIEVLVADTEDKVDRDPTAAGLLLEDLLTRLREAIGARIDESRPMPNCHPMTIGRDDDCRLEMVHTAAFCGKTQAHR